MTAHDGPEYALVEGIPYLDRVYEALKALPDVDGSFARDLENFRVRMCLREAGRCRIGIQTPELAAGGE